MAQSFRDTLDEFLDQSVDAGEDLPTQIELVPECETRATITSVRPGKFRNEDSGEWRATVEFMWTVNDPAIKEETGLDEPRVRQLIYLDVNKDWDGEGNPPLRFGKNMNINLNRLIKGLGMPSKFKWSNFMNESGWIRVAKPRNPDGAVFSEVAAVGQDEDSVKRPGRRR